MKITTEPSGWVNTSVNRKFWRDNTRTSWHGKAVMLKWILKTRGLVLFDSGLDEMLGSREYVRQWTYGLHYAYRRGSLLSDEKLSAYAVLTR
jgi:hypothetical protein